MPLDLAKQVGPLPLGAWAAIVAGGLGIAWYSRNGSGGGKAEPLVVEDTSGAAGVGVGAAGFINATPITVDNTASAITTNEQWAVAAINYLIAQNYDAAIADTAVRKYLESQQLTLQETAMIRFALVKLGSPPIPLPNPPLVPSIPKPTTPTVTPPKPAPQPQPQPAAPRYIIHTVTRGQSLWRIAQIYYGNGALWPRLWAANRAGTRRIDGAPGYISNPSFLNVGDRVLVPK